MTNRNMIVGFKYARYRAGRVGICRSRRESWEGADIAGWSILASSSDVGVGAPNDTLKVTVCSTYSPFYCVRRLHLGSPAVR